VTYADLDVIVDVIVLGNDDVDGGTEVDDLALTTSTLAHVVGDGGRSRPRRRRRRGRCT
jgi:hypothetical protein